ncbi:MAG: hypothetical protein GXY16_05390 [Syntrophomonadaceae bacterium]|nr:hypothetical protein [Syntrophomonadaceae bacterium]
MKKQTLVVLCISILLLSMIGCQTTAKKPMTNRSTNITNTGEMTPSERRVMASKLSNLAENVDGVQRAAVVVSSIAMTNNMTSRTPTSTTANKNINRVVNPEGVGNVNPNTVGNANPTQTAVKGNYSGLIVMVGLNLDSKTENNPTMARNIKQTVANKLKNSDQRISQVLVTTDPTLIQRINDVAAGIIQGKPINNFESDIKDMITKIKQQQPAF